MRFGPQIITMTFTLEYQCEIRFTTSGQMVCRIYPKDLDTNVHHVFTMWCKSKEDEDSAAALSDLPVGSKITVKGSAKTKTFTDEEGNSQSYRAFTVTEWKEA